MNKISRRSLLTGAAATGTASWAKALPIRTLQAASEMIGSGGQAPAWPVDFRFSPIEYQTLFCFADDHAKSLVNQRGELLYDFPASHFAGIGQFATIVSFTLAGMDRDHVSRQWMEAADVPILHTLIERPAVSFELTTFATNGPAEGRVDNVLLEVRARSGEARVCPRVKIQCAGICGLLEHSASPVITRADQQPWIYCLSTTPRPEEVVMWTMTGGYDIILENFTATPDAPVRYLFRIPQAGGTIGEAFESDALLAEARAYWKARKPFGGEVEISLPGVQNDFLHGCARNILQAREQKDGRLVFQVGPTVYRGLWIVDGNFILEAARYLGFDGEADEGLRSEWRAQAASGQIIAGGGGEHWKDTAIAMFTLVRACELKDDWALLRELRGQVKQGIDFLIGLRDQARRGKSTNGRYGLLMPGFADGGIAGLHSEFSNTLWVLAGLHAIARANERLKLSELDGAATFYRELRTAFDAAAKAEMVSDPRGFSYLPILMRDDPDWHLPDPWLRPRPQTGQWPLSHAIFPGSIFAKDDPIVAGHIALMQGCTREDVPAETGWLRHESLWTYNAPFVAQVYLWAGRREWAQRTFAGFLNHASPMFCWREEQPLQQASVAQYWGDMPHNWASAECVRYLRHRLVLEDEDTLRLFAGVLPSELAIREPFSLANTPTRFGRISLSAEPVGQRGWRVRFKRDGSRSPAQVELPLDLPGGRSWKLEGAAFRTSGQKILIAPETASWTWWW